MALTSPDRVLYVEQGLTKRDLAGYYIAVADAMLPHIAGRPITMVRCPAGVQGTCFFQQHPGARAGEALRRVDIQGSSGTRQHLVVEDEAGLVSLVQMGVLEIHVWGSRVEHLERPDRLIFDLDPGSNVAWPRVVAAAAELRDRLSQLGLGSFLKTTGGKGLHVVAPLDPRVEWGPVKAFAKAIAAAMERDSPRDYVIAMAKTERRGRIFIDYLRNDRGATAIAPFSTRARPGAPVATPLAWRELSPRLSPKSLDVPTVIERLQTLRDDSWAGFATLRQTISAKARAALGLS